MMAQRGAKPHLPLDRPSLGLHKQHKGISVLFMPGYPLANVCQNVTGKGKKLLLNYSPPVVRLRGFIKRKKA